MKRETIKKYWPVAAATLAVAGLAGGLAALLSDSPAPKKPQEFERPPAVRQVWQGVEMPGIRGGNIERLQELENPYDEAVEGQDMLQPYQELQPENETDTTSTSTPAVLDTEQPDSLTQDVEESLREKKPDLQVSDVQEITMDREALEKLLKNAPPEVIEATNTVLEGQNEFWFGLVYEAGNPQPYITLWQSSRRDANPFRMWQQGTEEEVEFVQEVRNLNNFLSPEVILPTFAEDEIREDPEGMFQFLVQRAFDSEYRALVTPDVVANAHTSLRIAGNNRFELLDGLYALAENPDHPPRHAALGLVRLAIMTTQNGSFEYFDDSTGQVQTVIPVQTYVSTEDFVDRIRTLDAIIHDQRRPWAAEQFNFAPEQYLQIMLGEFANEYVVGSHSAMKRLVDNYIGSERNLDRVMELVLHLGESLSRHHGYTYTDLGALQNFIAMTGKGTDRGVLSKTITGALGIPVVQATNVWHTTSYGNSSYEAALFSKGYFGSVHDLELYTFHFGEVEMVDLDGNGTRESVNTHTRDITDPRIQRGMPSTGKVYITKRLFGPNLEDNDITSVSTHHSTVDVAAPAGLYQLCVYNSRGGEHGWRPISPIAVSSAGGRATFPFVGNVPNPQFAPEGNRGNMYAIVKTQEARSMRHGVYDSADVHDVVVLSNDQVFDLEPSDVLIEERGGQMRPTVALPGDTEPGRY